MENRVKLPHRQWPKLKLSNNGFFIFALLLAVFLEGGVPSRVLAVGPSEFFYRAELIIKKQIAGVVRALSDIGNNARETAANMPDNFLEGIGVAGNEVIIPKLESVRLPEIVFESGLGKAQFAFSRFFDVAPAAFSSVVSQAKCAYGLNCPAANRFYDASVARTAAQKTPTTDTGTFEPGKTIVIKPKAQDAGRIGAVNGAKGAALSRAFDNSVAAIVPAVKGTETVNSIADFVIERTNTVIVDSDTKAKVNHILRWLDSDRSDFSLGETFSLPKSIAGESLGIGGNSDRDHFTVTGEGDVAAEGDLQVRGSFTLAGIQTLTNLSSFTASSTEPVITVVQNGSGPAIKADNVTLKGSTVATADSGALNFFDGSNYIDSTGNLVVSGNITPYRNIAQDLGSPTKYFNNLYAKTIYTAAINTSGQGVFNYPPATTDYADSALLINPTVAPAGSILLGIGVAGTPKLTVSSDGDITAGTYNGLTVNSTTGVFAVINGKILTVADDATISGSNTGDQTITLTGDVTGSGTGSFAATIGSGKVTNAMLAGNIAAAKLIGTDIDTLGTVTTGVWNAATIADNKIASALTGKTYNALTLTALAAGFTIAGGTLNKTLTLDADLAAGTVNAHLANTSNPHGVTKAQVGLGSAENTALSTWAGTANITTLGTITSGSWGGTVISPSKGGTGVANGSNNTITFSGNYALGLTLLNDTSLILPVSGTLATLAGAETLTNKTLTSPNITAPTGIVKSDVGLGNVDNTADSAKNVLSATKLAASRTINGVAFDGTGNIVVTADASTLTGNTLSSGILASSLTSVGTLANLAVTNPISGSVTGNAGTVTGFSPATGKILTVSRTMTLSGADDTSVITLPSGTKTLLATDGNGSSLTNLTAGNLDGTIPSGVLGNSIVYIGSTAIALNRATGNLALTGITSIDGNAATATKLAATKNINGVAFDGSGDITVTADANTLSGTTLHSTVTASSLTSVGTLANLTVTNPISGSVTGNAGTVTNGVYTNAANSFSLINPMTTLAESWIGPSNTAGIYFKSGNVGIGTTGPGTALQVGDGTTTGNYIMEKGTVSELYFGENTDVSHMGQTNSAKIMQVVAYPLAIGTFSAQPLIFGTNNTEQMRILSSGNVGIGTTGPGAMLDVYGTFIAGGADETNIVKITDSHISSDMHGTGLGIPLYLDSDGAAAAVLLQTVSGGKVGIGTTNPNSNLAVGDDIGANIGNTALAIGNASGGTAVLGVGYDNTNRGSVTWSGGQDGYMGLGTVTTTGGANWSSLILKDGKVGIGTTSPNGVLDVVGAKVIIRENILGRFSGNLLYYANEKYTLTTSATGTASITTPQEAFYPGDTYAAIAGGVSGGSVTVSVVKSSGFDVGTLASTIYPYIQSHGTLTTTIKVELLKQDGATWATAYDAASNTFGQDEVKFFGSTGVLSYPADFPVKGVRFTISNIAAGSAFYVRQFGFYNYRGNSSDASFVLQKGTAYLGLDGSYVGIGTPSPGYQLTLSTNSAAKPTSDHWTISSDARLKDNVVNIFSPLETVMRLQGREFEYKDKQKYGSSRQYGFIAQEVEQVIPRWVQTGVDGYKTLTIAGDTALLVEAIKEQQGQIADLKLQLDDLGSMAATSTLDVAQGGSNPMQWLMNGLQSLGLVLRDGVANLKAVVAGKVVTDEVVSKRVCVAGEDGETVCLDKSQLKALIEKSGTPSLTVTTYPSATDSGNSTSTAETGGN